MTDPQVGMLMLFLFIFIIMLGFPIAFTLMAMGVGFGFYAYYVPGQEIFQNRIFITAGAEGVRGDVERRAHRGAAVSVHGIRGRAREHPRPSVSLSANIDEERSRRARGGDADHLRDVCDRHRHCRRRGDADGAAGLSRHVARRLRRQAFGRRGLRRRLPRHPDPAEHPLDRLCRHCRRLGGQTICSRLHSGVHPHRLLHSVRDRARDDQSRACSQAAEGADGYSVHPGDLGAVDLVLPARAADHLACSGAILFGLATPSEAAGIGALGGLLAGGRLRRAALQSAEGIGVPDRARHCHGLLPVHRFVDIFIRFRACSAGRAWSSGSSSI